jgi:uncharacterized protein YdeI (YjbR/CyaY-like superfamily)
MRQLAPIAMSPTSGQQLTARKLDQREIVGENLLSVSAAASGPRVMSRFHLEIAGRITMGTRDDRVDAYIANSADFARPILTHLRDLIHATCPDVEETMKWSHPHFLYKGMLCSMASFKQHCAFGFWKGSLVVKKADTAGEAAMGQCGRIINVKDLPSKKVLSGYIKEAMQLNDAGVKVPARAKPKQPKEVVVPDDLVSALRNNGKALATFEGFPPSHKREYITWITEAKTQATRARRLETTIEWLAEGKPRNWKYMNC